MRSPSVHQHFLICRLGSSFCILAIGLTARLGLMMWPQLQASIGGCLNLIDFDQLLDLLNFDTGGSLHRILSHHQKAIAFSNTQEILRRRTQPVAKSDRLQQHRGNFEPRATTSDTNDKERSPSATPGEFSTTRGDRLNDRFWMEIDPPEFRFNQRLLNSIDFKRSHVLKRVVIEGSK